MDIPCIFPLITNCLDDNLGVPGLEPPKCQRKANRSPLRIDLDGDDFGYMNGMIGNMTVLGCAGVPALLNGWNWMKFR